VEETIGLELCILGTMKPNKKDPTNLILIEKEQAASLEDPLGYNSKESLSSFSHYDKPIPGKD
jgi:hypothetical protein